MPKWLSAPPSAKACITCGIPLVLKNARDLTRKKYCSRTCGGVRLRPSVQIELTNKELEVIDGALLGDGWISKKKGRKALCFGYSCIDLDITELVAASLPSGQMREPYQYKSASGFSKENTVAFGTYSAASFTFSRIHERWYKLGKKKVPEDLVLTPTVGLFWHLGDGCAHKNRVDLSTQGFLYEEVKERLAPMVEQVTNVVNGTAIYLEKGNPRLYLRPPCAHAWLEFIGACPVQSKLYRWALTGDPNPLREARLSNDELIEVVQWLMRGAKPLEIANRLGRNRNTIIAAVQRIRKCHTG